MKKLTKTHWGRLRRKLLPKLKERGSMTRLAEHLGVSRQHVWVWIREDVAPNFNHGKEIECWILEQ